MLISSKRDSDEWLPQGEAARRVGLSREALFAGHVAEQIRRRAGVGGHGWLYSLSDAARYVAERKKAGDDEVGAIYDRIVSWAVKHHEELRTGEARGLGRYISTSETLGKRVVAIVTDVFHKLIGGEAKTLHVVSEFRKRGLLVSETPRKAKRVVLFGRQDTHVPSAYRLYSYWVIVPGTPVEVTHPAVHAMESMEHGEVIAEEVEEQEAEAKFVDRPVRGINPHYDLIVEWVHDHDEDFQTPGNPYGRYLQPPEDAVAIGSGRIVAIWPEAFLAFAKRSHFDADRIAAVLRDKGLLLVDGHRLKKLVRLGPAPVGEFQTKWASSVLRHAYCVALPERPVTKTRHVEAEVMNDMTQNDMVQADAEKPLVSTRIAIVGGDHRAEQVSWPKGFDLRFFSGSREGGAKEIRRLEQACAAGTIGCVVWLSRWNASGAVNKIKALGPPLIVWERGLGQLAKALPELVAPKGIRPEKEEPKRDLDIPPEMLFVTGQSEPTESSETVSETPPEIVPETGTEESTEKTRPVAVTMPTPAARSDGWTARELETIQEAIRQKLGGQILIRFFRKEVPESTRSDSAVARMRTRILERYATGTPEPLGVSTDVPETQESESSDSEKVTEENPSWLSHADTVRETKLSHNQVYRGYKTGMIHRRMHEDGTWRYNLSDAYAYAAKQYREEAGQIDETSLASQAASETPDEVSVLDLQEESPEWYAWWEAHDDGSEMIKVCAKRLGFSNQRIKHERKLRGILRSWGQKGVVRSTQEELPFEVQESVEESVKETVPLEVGGTLAVSNEVSLTELVRAIGVLVDSGMLGAENALTMIRKKVG